MKTNLEARSIPQRYVVPRERWLIPYIWVKDVEPLDQGLDAQNKFTVVNENLKEGLDLILPGRHVIVLARDYAYHPRKVGIYQFVRGNNAEIAQFHRRKLINEQMMRSRDPSILFRIPAMLDQFAPLEERAVEEELFKQLIMKATFGQSVDKELVKALELELNFLRDRISSEGK